MISLDPGMVKQELDQARKFMRAYIDKRAQMIRRCAGAHYRTDHGDSESMATTVVEERTPENYLFAYKQFVKPQIVFGRPVCVVTPTRAETDAQQAKAIQMAINYWAKETGWKTTLSRVVDDCFFGFGVTKCGIAPRGRYTSAAIGRGGQDGVEGDFEQVRNWPFAVRVDPRDFVIDYRARSLSQARFIGHFYERDLDDIKADAEFDPRVTSQLSEQESEDENFGEPFHRYKTPDGASRSRMRMLELFFPEHGLIATYVDMGGRLVELKRAGYWGPDEGPYTIWGLEELAGELLPISPLMALYEQFLELQTHAIAAAKSALRHKKIGVFQAANRGDAERIVNAESGDMVPTMDPKSVSEIEIGGASQYQLNFLDFLRLRLDRNLGFTDAQRGMADSSTTATASQIARSSSDLRVDGMRDRIADCVTSVYRKVGWYFFNDDSIGRIEMSVEDPASGRMREGVLIAGSVAGGAYVENVYFPPPPLADYSDMMIDIDPRSLSRQTDALSQKRAQDTMALLAQIAPLIVQMPFINWRWLLDEYGAAFNIRDFSRIVLRDDVSLFPPAGMLGIDPYTMQPTATASPYSSMQSSPPNILRTAESNTGLMSNLAPD